MKSVQTAHASGTNILCLDGAMVVACIYVMLAITNIMTMRLIMFESVIGIGENKQMYEPKYLSKWSYDGPTPFDTRTNYMGADLRDYYIAGSRTRDSGVLDQSNFDYVWNELKQWQTDDDSPVEIHGFNHWACGWYELIVVHQNAEAALIVADKLREQLEDYPVLDEEDFSNREYEQACKWWEQMSLRDRLDAIEQYGNRSETAFLASRFDDLSVALSHCDDSGSLMQYLSQD